VSVAGSEMLGCVGDGIIGHEMVECVGERT
jgi:hypothetical protein